MGRGSKEIVITAEGVNELKDIPRMLDLVSEELAEFDNYMRRVAMSELAAHERAVLRSYLMWKVLDPPVQEVSGENGGTLPNQGGT